MLNYILKHLLKITLFTTIFAGFALAFGLYQIFSLTPDDYLQGSLIKIFYIHVPSAWLAISFYFIAAVFSIAYLIFKNFIYFIIAKSIAYADMYLTISALVTGSIWGKAAWGTWWIWDARLTSMFLLLCFICMYFLINNSFNNEIRSAKTSSIFAIIGLINLPIIKFSVYLWSTLHQKSTIFTLEGSKMDHEMIKPLFSMTCFILSFAILLTLLNIKNEIVLRKVRNRLVS